MREHRSGYVTGKSGSCRARHSTRMHASNDVRTHGRILRFLFLFFFSYAVGRWRRWMQSAGSASRDSAATNGSCWATTSTQPMLMASRRGSPALCNHSTVSLRCTAGCVATSYLSTCAAQAWAPRDALAWRATRAAARLLAARGMSAVTAASLVRAHVEAA